MTEEAYVKASLAQPSLFYQPAARIAKNIRDMVKEFAADGLTEERYLQAALKRPTLFYQSPTTIAAHIRHYFRLADNRLLKIELKKEDSPDALTMHAQLLTSLLGNPVLLTLATKNIEQREALALLNEEQLSLYSIHHVNKSTITSKLAAYVDALDHKLPDVTPTADIAAEVPRTMIDAGSVAAGEMLLVSLAKRGALDENLTLKVMSKVGRAA